MVEKLLYACRPYFLSSLTKQRQYPAFETIAYSIYIFQIQYLFIITLKRSRIWYDITVDYLKYQLHAWLFHDLVNIANNSVNYNIYLYGLIILVFCTGYRYIMVWLFQNWLFTLAFWLLSRIVSSLLQLKYSLTSYISWALLCIWSFTSSRNEHRNNINFNNCAK